MVVYASSDFLLLDFFVGGGGVGSRGAKFHNFDYKITTLSCYCYDFKEFECRL